MKRALVLIATIAALTCILDADRPRSRAESAPAAGIRPIEQLSWLVGGVWVAAVDHNELRRIETRYEWSTNHAFIRFTSRFVMTSGPKDRYDGDFYYDPTTKRLTMWYVDDDGVVSQGPVDIRETSWSSEFAQGGDDGNTASYRVEVQRNGDDRYTWTGSARSGEAWKPFLSLVYARQQS